MVEIKNRRKWWSTETPPPARGSFFFFCLVPFWFSYEELLSLDSGLVSVALASPWLRQAGIERKKAKANGDLSLGYLILARVKGFPTWLAKVQFPSSCSVEQWVFSFFGVVCDFFCWLFCRMGSCLVATIATILVLWQKDFIWAAFEESMMLLASMIV